MFVFRHSDKVPIYEDSVDNHVRPPLDFFPRLDSFSLVIQEAYVISLVSSRSKSLSLLGG